MSTKASDVAARLGRSLSGSAVPAVTEVQQPAPPSPPPVPSRGVGRTTERFTVDLSPDLNDALGRWATQRKRVVGRRVAKTEVARVLIELLLDDSSLAMQVEERLTAAEG